MRPVLHGDVSSAARVLYALAPGMRETIGKRMIAEAECADRFARTNGQIHPMFGNGSLMGAARKRMMAPEPGFDDPEYCRCFELILRCLVDWQINRTHS